MFAKLLAVASLATAVVASARPPPSSQFEADVWAVIDPVIEWNSELFGITAEDVFDEWHDENGKPKGTPEQIQEFVEQGVAAWKTAGQGLAELAKTVDVKTANADYLTLLEALFPASFDTTWFYRLAAPWSAGLGISLDDAKALGAKYDSAWLGAILDFETVVPAATRDYEVVTSFFWTGKELRNYYYPNVAEHIEAIPWEPVVKYCDKNKRNCSDGLKAYQSGTCYSTADTNVKVEYVGVANNRLGFNWQCQTYTDSACTTKVFVPAQPCTLEPPFDVYCRDTTDWNGVFGGSGNPTSTESNPSGLGAVSVGSFKCT